MSPLALPIKGVWFGWPTWINTWINALLAATQQIQYLSLNLPPPSTEYSLEDYAFFLFSFHHWKQWCSSSGITSWSAATWALASSRSEHILFWCSVFDSAFLGSSDELLSATDGERDWDWCQGSSSLEINVITMLPCSRCLSCWTLRTDRAFSESAAFNLNAQLLWALGVNCRRCLHDVTLQPSDRDHVCLFGSLYPTMGTFLPLSEAITFLELWKKHLF